MKRFHLIVLLSTAVLSVHLFPVEYKGAISQLSPLSTETFKNLATAVVEASGNTIKTEIVPASRGIANVENKTADFFTAIIALKDPAKIAALKYDYSTADTHNVVFVLYTKKDLNIDVEELKKGNPKNYNIETDASLLDDFTFKATPSTNIEGSLRKVDTAKIDGYIFSQPTVDPLLKSLGLKNIKRVYYETFNGKFIIAKGQKGGAIDKMISEGMNKIRSNGRYQEIMGALIAAGSKYIEWQP
jgi:polar amino acid transport system substrate-binding protein